MPHARLTGDVGGPKRHQRSVSWMPRKIHAEREDKKYEDKSI